MKVGITGTSFSGKTTIFRAITGMEHGAESGLKTAAVEGIVELPDERLCLLEDCFHPEKVTGVKVHVFDLPGSCARDGSRLKTLSPGLIAQMRQMDVLCCVLDCFSDPDCASAKVAELMEGFRQELIFADLEIASGKYERFLKGEKESFAGEKPAIEKIKQGLEQEVEVKAIGISASVLHNFSGYQFLTLKPVIYVLNQSESSPLSTDSLTLAESHAAKRGGCAVAVFGKFELELKELEPNERQEFLSDMGMSESGIYRLLEQIRESLNLITFFTTVGRQLRAWAIPAGTSVQKAAGKIHTDMEKGFIKAEILAYDDLKQLGSVQACKKEGKVRQEGRDYIVKDGDIVTIKFNV